VRAATKVIWAIPAQRAPPVAMASLDLKVLPERPAMPVQRAPLDTARLVTLVCGATLVRRVLKAQKGFKDFKVGSDKPE
jgi:hypothetical protein